MPGTIHPAQLVPAAQVSSGHRKLCNTHFSEIEVPFRWHLKTDGSLDKIRHWARNAMHGNLSSFLRDTVVQIRKSSPGCVISTISLRKASQGWRDKATEAVDGLARGFPTATLSGSPGGVSKHVGGFSEPALFFINQNRCSQGRGFISTRDSVLHFLQLFLISKHAPSESSSFS